MLTCDIVLTPLDNCLISRTPKLYRFNEYPELGILRLDRFTFWVHDIKHQKGVIVSSWDTAKLVLRELSQEF